ncbi:hypothetical protein HK102_000390 [Quaeritorhiza haematococci]|nr:hypothetical protein HK102_000390 [Quaeritorhiza haematococci]
MQANKNNIRDSFRRRRKAAMLGIAAVATAAITSVGVSANPVQPLRHSDAEMREWSKELASLIVKRNVNGMDLDEQEAARIEFLQAKRREIVNVYKRATVSTATIAEATATASAAAPAATSTCPADLLTCGNFACTDALNQYGGVQCACSYDADGKPIIDDGCSVQINCHQYYCTDGEDGQWTCSIM